MILCDNQLGFLLKFMNSHSSSMKEYAIQEINLLLWVAFIGITALLLHNLFVFFKIWVYGCRIPGPPSPSFYGHSWLFSGANPQLHLTDSAEVPGVGSYILTDPYKNAAFFPFGAGLRACVGQKFAVLGIASMLASLLERYEIKLVPESDIEPKSSVVDCVLQLVPSPKIVFVRRNA